MAKPKRWITTEPRLDCVQCGIYWYREAGETDPGFYYICEVAPHCISMGTRQISRDRFVGRYELWPVPIVLPGQEGKRDTWLIRLITAKPGHPLYKYIEPGVGERVTSDPNEAWRFASKEQAKVFIQWATNSKEWKAVPFPVDYAETVLMEKATRWDACEHCERPGPDVEHRDGADMKLCDGCIVELSDLAKNQAQKKGEGFD